MAHQNTIPTNTAGLDFTTAHLPVANVRDPNNPFPEEQFSVMTDVPVFTEHQTLSRDGRELKFGRKELEAITHRCNRRISQTGEYAAITIGHTPSPEAVKSGATMPDLVGFAGPFRLGVLGSEGENQRYAILANFYIFKDEMQRVRKHPRRSPEVWLEDQYEEMFFDPIALLGSEAPRLDMGLTLYSAIRHEKETRQVEKYTASSAVAPSAGNVFIPTHGEDEQQKYQPIVNEETTMALSPQDVSQIVDAIEQLDWVQGVKGMLSESQESPGSLGQGEEGPPAAPPAAPPEAAQPEAMQAPAPAEVPPEEQAYIDSMKESGEPALPPSENGENGEEEYIGPMLAAGVGGALSGALKKNAAGTEEEEEPQQEEAEYRRGRHAGDPQADTARVRGGGVPNRRVFQAGSEDDTTGSQLAENIMKEANGNGNGNGNGPPQQEEEDYGGFGMGNPRNKPMAKGKNFTSAGKRYAADEATGVGNGETINVPDGGAELSKGPKKYTADDGDEFELDDEDQEELKSYMARKYAASVDGNELGNGSPTVEGSAKSQDGDAKPVGGDVADEKNEAVESFSRMSTQLAHTQRRLRQAETAIDNERNARVNAERYSALSDRRNHFVFDMDREVGISQYSKMNEEQFGNHIQSIEQNYQRIPVETDLRVFGEGIKAHGTNNTEDYSRGVSDRAYQICEQKVLRGEEVNYEEVVKGLRDGSLRG